MSHFPACHVLFPIDVEGRYEAFFLATEEHLAKTYPLDSYFFTWRVPATCIFGHNQNPLTEMDLDFCRRHNIRLCRRKSGGGTVFAEYSNTMLSLVTESVPVEELYHEYAHTVAQTLRKLGAPVQVSGRNDIETIDHKKISGNAFYRLPQRNIVHGTMLYDTNLPLMTGALTPPSIKMQSRGVKSVRSRIGLLKDYIQTDQEGLRQFLIDNLTNRSITLTLDDIRAIEQIEQTYYEEDFLWGRSQTSASVVRKGYIDGCGMLEISLDVQDGRVEQVVVGGDYFEVEKNQADKVFNQAFLHCPYNPIALKERILLHHPEESILQLPTDELIALICKTEE
ncbi:MAG: lipoyltransferase [Alloprevotella sp.]|nr:lipoyltransferase [Alloprevotella sp.]